jgi:hypothetical protein
MSRSLLIARKKLIGQRVTLENQIRGLAVVFGVRLPRALSPAFIEQALRASEGIEGLSAAMHGLAAGYPRGVSNLVPNESRNFEAQNGTSRRFSAQKCTTNVRLLVWRFI